MSEYCLSCWNKTKGTALTPRDVILSAHDDDGRCSHCHKVGQVVVRVPTRSPLGRLECWYWRMRDRGGK